MYPNLIKIILVLFATSIFAALISMSINIYFSPATLSKQAMIIFGGVIIILYIGIAYFIFKRKNWARIVWLVIVLFGVVSLVLGQSHPKFYHEAVKYNYFFQSIIQPLIVVLLFLPSSNAWFKQK